MSAVVIDLCVDSVVSKTTSVAFLRATPPDGTAIEPFRQLDWIVEEFVAKYKNEMTRKSFRDTVVYFKRALIERLRPTGEDGALRPFDRFVDLHSLTLYDLLHWLQAKGCAPHTIKSATRVVAAVTRYCISRRWIKAVHLIHPRMPRPQRTSTLFDPYSQAELNYVRMAIQPFLIQVEKLNLGYVRSGMGYDPRTKKHYRLADGSRGSHWSQWHNIVWYFENVLQCQALPMKTLESAGHKYFVARVYEFHGGINATYERLGTGQSPSTRLVIPLLIKLAWETGLNPSTLYLLKRDCYQPEHPLTGQPYLRYYKERGQGETDLHLALFDLKPRPNGDLPDLGVRMLSGKQAILIRKTIETILHLTEPLVDQAPSQCKNHLFLVRRVARPGATANLPKVRFEISGISKQDTGQWYRSQQEDTARRMRESAETQPIEIPRYLNLVRFRSTMADRLVREGVDFFSVQAIMGHRHAGTTADYLRAHLIEGPIRIELEAHLRKVQRNMQDLAATPKPYATPENIEQLGRDGVIYKGVLCDCKNAYDPPENIKRLLKRAGGWEEGKPCSYYDMCLLCDNLLVTRRSLPLIIQHEREIDAGSVSGTPASPLYEKKRAVLQDIRNYFGPEDIAWAEEVAQRAMPMIDPMTYRGYQLE